MLRTLFILAIGAGLVGCAQFRDTVGCYTHTDVRFGFVEQFGDPKGGGLSGETKTISEHPSHGGISTSNFRLDRPDSYANETFLTDVTLRFGPGACAQ